MTASTNELDLQMMHRAIALAMRGRGRVEPNPMVGCVLVKDGRVIGEGFHTQYGGPHAEPAALAACTESPSGATAYVTLEPCCHTNKKTPPCTPALIAAGIVRVVVGSVDPNPDVNGRGLDLLRAAGIRVDRDVLEESARQLIAPFIGRVVYDRPYVTLKWAQTADGKVAGPGGARMQISNPASTRAVHELRARSDAILIGINTVLGDDPLLTARDVASPRPVVRAVLDARLRIPMSSKLVRTARQHRLFVHFDRHLSHAQHKAHALREAGVEPFMVNSTHAGLRLDEVLNSLAGLGATHVLVEPGPTLARSFLQQPELTDRLCVIQSPANAPDPQSLPAADVPANYIKVAEIELDGDRLTEYLNPSSPLFFAPDRSAEMTEMIRVND